MNMFAIAAVTTAAVAGTAVAQKSVARVEVGVAGTDLSGYFDLMDTNVSVDGSVITYSASSISILGFDIELGETEIANIGDFSLSIDTNAQRSGGSQSVTLNFNNATASFFNTSFSFSAAPVSFAPLSNVTGSASAAVTLIDSPFAPGDAQLSPNGAGAYSATFNGGSVFQDFFGSGVTAPDGGSNVASASTGGFIPIAGSVSEISAEWGFTLSALAQATGTSTFTITPTPASLGLLGLGGMLAARRRR